MTPADDVKVLLSAPPFYTFSRSWRHGTAANFRTLARKPLAPPRLCRLLTRAVHLGLGGQFRPDVIASSCLFGLSLARVSKMYRAWLTPVETGHGCC